MDGLEETSVLEYARTHGIAKDHQQLDPMQLFDQVRDSECAQRNPPMGSTSQFLDFENPKFSSYTTTIETRNEKMVLDKDGARFLSSVLREVISLQATPDHNFEEPISFECPKYQNQDDLKIDGPLLSIEKESRLHASTKMTDPVELLNEIVPDLADRERASIDEGLEFPEYFWELPSMFDRDPSTEKLDASKDTVRVLQDVMGYFDEEKHRKGVEALITSTILEVAPITHTPTPLYIESEEQHECNDISAPRHSSDSDSDTFSANELVTEDAITNQQTTSLPIDEATEDSERHLGSKSKLPSVADSVTSFSGSLGTLSAFMQTRCHKNKRRKLDNESRYFNSTSKDRTETSPDKLDTLEKPTEHTKVPSSPVASHEVHDLNLYPKNLTEKCSVPLTLIMSTRLLRSDSTLVRSLEGISSSQSLRLVFRDYKEAQSSQSHVISEADLIVSPTTGIILANSYETAQKYLPGQGRPGIESPLKARIIQTAPRYETLYVFVRSPIRMDIKTLESIRDLTSYCVSLNHACNIKVLIITTDHVLQWILAIATKHTTDMMLLTSPLKAATAVAQQFHDDQTQWEAFLQNAGFNPFAAQSVLALLRTSSTDPRYPANSNQASALFRFVKMPCQARRDMFQEILGYRVLSRVEKVIDMDWQVDWAADLA
ncbi:hypothetical protein TSTA_056640 [Talaromyces stipitatus ATCC 10500]|uniref:Uncharacterized protein n=1 Tax=Talaromyces stipitatus (strain ATCC 10500 / CBS 375.48 / QM 6759 / NRRL 1006) TaxID=441959 RepID=B8MRK6_TALSN|nr:uncharacterized protein TSTA_056640 [Talaromyces stipitatus ATCC 10500]EED13163.1 hypothetical protein TSTA_056640 [Talaromyces stipitatus ATCC 10500]